MLSLAYCKLSLEEHLLYYNEKLFSATTLALCASTTNENLSPTPLRRQKK